MTIVIEKCVKSYAGREVLNIPSLALKMDGIYGVVGPNGSGKTTLLRIVAGLEHPDSGQIIYPEAWKGMDLRRRVTYVAQRPYMMEGTVADNIAWPLKIRGFSNKQIAQRTEELLMQIGIENLRDQEALGLSGGEAQKAALARALAFRPQVLLLDEPTASMDAGSAALFETTIARYQKETAGIIVLVTHSFDLAQRCCSTLLSLEKGMVTVYKENGSEKRSGMGS